MERDVEPPGKKAAEKLVHVARRMLGSRRHPEWTHAGFGRSVSRFADTDRTANARDEGFPTAAQGSMGQVAWPASSAAAGRWQHTHRAEHGQRAYLSLVRLYSVARQQLPCEPRVHHRLHEGRRSKRAAGCWLRRAALRHPPAARADVPRQHGPGPVWRPRAARPCPTRRTARCHATLTRQHGPGPLRPRAACPAPRGVQPGGMPHSPAGPAG